MWKSELPARQGEAWIPPLTGGRQVHAVRPIPVPIPSRRPETAASRVRLLDDLAQVLSGSESREEAARALLKLACETTNHARGLLALFDARGRVEAQEVQDWVSAVPTDHLQQQRCQLRPCLIRPGEAFGLVEPRLVIPIGPAGRGVVLLEGLLEDSPDAADVLALGQAVGRLIERWLEESLQRHQLREELRQTRYSSSPSSAAVVASGRLVSIRLKLKQLAIGTGALFLQAEDGVETEDLARLFHAYGPRTAAGPFVALALAALPPHRLDDELFGVSGGIRAASGGTLLLEQPECLSEAAQDRLAESLRSGTVKVRLVVASSRSVTDLVKSGSLRPELAEMLGANRVVVPPLRAQPSDIPSLVELILRQMGPTPDATPRAINEKAMQHLVAFPWPGNVRQLRQVLESCAAKAGNHAITPKHLPVEIRALGSSPYARFPSLREVERRYITEVLSSVRNKREAAKVLGIAPSTLYEKLARYEIDV